MYIYASMELFFSSHASFVINKNNWELAYYDQYTKGNNDVLEFQNISSLPLKLPSVRMKSSYAHSEQARNRDMEWGNPKVGLRLFTTYKDRGA